MNTKQGFSTLLTVLITAVAVGVLSGVITYSYAASKKDLEIEDLKEQLSQIKGEGVDETANWKTYTNDKYKYSIGVPNDWTTKNVSNDPNVDQVRIQASKDSGLIGEPYPFIDILSSATADGGRGISEDCSKYLELKVNFGSEKVNRTVTSCENGRIEVFYGNHPKNGQINYWAEANQHGDDEAIMIFDQILSTFQFTK